MMAMTDDYRVEVMGEILAIVLQLFPVLSDTPAITPFVIK